MGKVKEPEDLGIKIGTKEEKAWQNILDGATDAVAAGRREMIINEEIILLANKMIEEEKEKLK